MRSSRMRGYGAWNQGWRDAQRTPPGPSGGPGIFFWLFILLVLVTCVQVAIQGHPFAILLGLAVLAGALKGHN
jgi:hypothetical protein